MFFDEPVISDYSNMPSFPRGIASYADVLRGLSRVSPHECLLKQVVKFLSHCSQISAGTHVQIMGEPIGAVEVKMLTSQT